MRRIVTIFSAAILSAGCAGVGGVAEPGASGPVEDAFQQRARVVAEAWADGTATDAWRNGFVPLQDLTVPPADGFRTDEMKQAFLAGWYVLRTTLPPVQSAQAQPVRFADGGTMQVGVVSAAEAYAAIDKGDAPCPGTDPIPDPGPSASPDTPTSTQVPGSCTSLGVTGATLGQVTLRTSRGEATVPAWLFSVTGLDDPVARVAVVPAQVTAVPSPSVPPAPAQPGLVTAQDLVAVDGTKITYRLGVGACDKDIRPLFFETDTVVVVGGQVSPPTTGVCIDLLKLEPVTVTLAEPLGERPVVDAATGTALTLTVR